MTIPIPRCSAILLALAASVAAAPGQELAVSGAVLGPAGGGLQGARVELQRLLPAHRLAALQLAGEAAPQVLAQTRSDRDGSYRLAAPGPGFFKVVVRHPEILPAGHELSPLLDDRQLADLAVQRRSELLTRVVDAQRRPVAGLTLAVRGGSGDTVSRRVQSLLT